MQKIYRGGLFFLFILSVQAAGLCAEETGAEKSVLGDDIYSFPMNYVEKPLGFRETLPGYAEEPLGFREEPPGYQKEPTGFRENPPGFIEKKDHPNANNDPENILTTKTHPSNNPAEWLRIPREEHPRSASKEKKESV